MKARRSGTSSRSTKPSEDRCPECGKGRLRRVLATKSFRVEDRRVRVPGLLPLECDACRAQVWPQEEVKRVRQVVEIKLRRAAA
jgi:uncharacterized protein with PIN domain